jgi:hypothetical protein
LKCLLIISFLVYYMAASSCHSKTRRETTGEEKAAFREMETDLIREYSKLFSFYQHDNDSLETQSDLFSGKMISYIKNNPATLNYPFQLLKDSNAVDIATSSDSLFRIYSWDTWLGGTMHYFDNIYQYKSGDKIYFLHSEKDGDDPKAFYSEIFTIKTENKTWYLVVGNTISSTKDAAQFIRAVTIENNAVNDTGKLFRTKTKSLNEIYVAFDFFSVVDRPERPLKLIKYDPDKKILYIPIVKEEGKVTDKFILYQFNGQYFEHILTEKASGENR